MSSTVAFACSILQVKSVDGHATVASSRGSLRHMCGRLLPHARGRSKLGSPHRSTFARFPAWLASTDVSAFSSRRKLRSR
eukprot:1947782-Pleurochrysis_carterae.AAC.1